jgi:hypothetical protein
VVVTRGSLRGEKPPPTRLAPLVGLDLEPGRDVRLDLVEGDRGVRTSQDGDDFRTLSKDLDRRREGGSST